MNTTNSKAAPDRARRRFASWAGISILAIGAIAAVGGTASAAGEAGFAVIDCNLPGDQFMVADGKTVDWNVEAVDANDQVVMKLTPIDSATRPTKIYRSYTVPPRVIYDSVRFTNLRTGGIGRAKPVVETCAPNPINFATAPGTGLVPIPPIRVLDTRLFLIADGPGVAQPVAAGSVIEVQVTGRDVIPADASAVQLNIAAVQPLGVGHVRVYPCDTPRPLTSNLNYVQAETRAANVFVKPGSNGKVCLYTSTATHLLVDIQGYVPTKSAPVAIKPVRVADTRATEPVDGPGLLPKQQVNGTVRLDMTKLASFTDVPADAGGYVVNITATNSAEVGYVSVNVCRTGPFADPVSSAVNFIPGRATANLAYGNNGDELCIDTSRSVDLIVDVVGYTTAVGTPQILNHNLRLLDTRSPSAGGSGTIDNKHSGVGRIAAGTVYTLDVSGRQGILGAGSVPSNIAAAVVNITGIRPDDNGHITAYACGQKPETSNLNIRSGEATANMSLVPVSADGKICLYTSIGTDLVVDIAGFVPSAKTVPTVTPIEISQSRPTTTLQVYGGQAPYRLVGSVPAPVNLKMSADGAITYTGDPAAFTHYSGVLAFSDANGNLMTVRLFVAWYPPSAEIDDIYGPVP